MTPLWGTNHFIEALFHNRIIINTPALPPLERIAEKEDIQFIEEQLASALNEKYEAIRRSEMERQQKERAIQLLLGLGVPSDEIGRQLGLSDVEMERF